MFGISYPPGLIYDHPLQFLGSLSQPYFGRFSEPPLFVSENFRDAPLVISSPLYSESRSGWRRLLGEVFSRYRRLFQFQDCLTCRIAFVEMGSMLWADVWYLGKVPPPQSAYPPPLFSYLHCRLRGGRLYPKNLSGQMEPSHPGPLGGEGGAISGWSCPNALKSVCKLAVKYVQPVTLYDLALD